MSGENIYFRSQFLKQYETILQQFQHKRKLIEIRSNEYLFEIVLNFRDDFNILFVN